MSKNIKKSRKICGNDYSNLKGWEANYLKTLVKYKKLYCTKKPARRW